MLLKNLGWKIQCKTPITNRYGAQESNSWIYLIFVTSLFQAALKPHSRSPGDAMLAIQQPLCNYRLQNQENEPISGKIIPELSSFAKLSASWPILH